MILNKHYSTAKDDIDAYRASALLLLFTLLSPDDKASFGSILGHKTKVVFRYPLSSPHICYV
jgi:hypothetical protein